MVLYCTVLILQKREQNNSRELTFYIRILLYSTKNGSAKFSIILCFIVWDFMLRVLLLCWQKSDLNSATTNVSINVAFKLNIFYGLPQFKKPPLSSRSRFFHFTEKHWRLRNFLQTTSLHMDHQRERIKGGWGTYIQIAK